jgi:hypothetical protein
VETVRDLGEVDPWQESLQRSLARRGRLPRSSPELARLRPARDLSDEEFMQDYASYWRMRREAAARRPLMPLVGVGGVSTIALLAAALPNLLGGRGASPHAERLAYVDHSGRSPVAVAAAPRARRAHTSRLVLGSPMRRRTTMTATTQSARKPAHLAPVRVKTHAAPARPAPAKPAPVHHTTRPAHPTAKPASHPRPVLTASVASSPKPKPVATAADSQTATHSTAAKPHPTAAAAPTTSSEGYVNPFAHASVTPERIDQGVDYGGTGPLGAIGAGTITYVGTTGTGWPGAFIEFRLSNGPDAGRYVFYAESIVPASGLHVGQRVSAGQVIATMTGDSGGIEVGWGAGIGTETYAMKTGEWKPGMDESNAPTASGKSFSALIASLGGPAGKIEG